MGGWTEDNLLDFMKVFKNVFGRDIEGIKDAEQEWVCKRFTNRLFKALDWTQVVHTQYVDVSYVGKGDIDRMTVKKDFCLTASQCKDIANFIVGRIQGGKIGELHSFAVMNYIENGVDLWKNYFGDLKRMYTKSTVGNDIPEKQTTWIVAEDELPEEGTLCAVANKDGGFYVAMYKVDGIWRELESKGRFVDYWMPLPEPPTNQ